MDSPLPPRSESGTPSQDDRSSFLAQHDISEDILRDISDDLVSIARTAGSMVIDAYPSIETSETKNNTSDRVTATDKAVENFVRDHLTVRYPGFGFLGEETFKTGDKLENKPTFVCDPIDGTLNFVHGFPNIAISIALTIEKKPFIGVVYNPFRGDMFRAIKWQGAFLTTSKGVSHRLPFSPISKPLRSLNDCLVAIEWGNQRAGPNWELRTEVHKQLLTSKEAGGAMVNSIRSNGSTALDFCYVAAGWIDLFWEGARGYGMSRLGGAS